MPPKTFSCPEGEVEGRGADCSGTNGRSESSMWYVPLPRRGQPSGRTSDWTSISPSPETGFVENRRHSRGHGHGWRLDCQARRLRRRGRLARRSLDGAHISRHQRRAGEIGPHDPQARMKASSLVARPRTSSVSGRAIEPVTLIDPPAARTANSGSPSVTVARSSVPAVI